jgi:N6-L-threonylcarbamoyladenine synthase
MKILGIETSCDETAAAIIKDGQKIISNVVASSLALHQKSGGIIPEIAAREQLRCIIPIIEEALGQKLNKKKPSIEAIAVTVGPGLIGSLLVGVETAKSLAYLWQKPIIPINHLQGHLYANWLARKEPSFPALGLVVSGGHSDLVLMKSHQQIKWLGGTRDDAAGECFDKCARLLNLGYPGGPAISQEAKKFKEKRTSINLPRPMIKSDDFDFSFSGLKTAVLNKVKKLKEKNKFNPKVISEMSFEIQEAITDVLVKKTIRATEKYEAKSLLLAGGVSANQRLKEKMREKTNPKIDLFIPPPNLCTDNAAPIASNAYFNFKPQPSAKIQANSSLTIEEMIK